MSDDGLLEPDVYATLVAWATAHSGRKVRIDNLWEVPDYAAPDDGLHAETHEGRLTVWAQAARRGVCCSTVALGLKGTTTSWLYPDAIWPEGAISATAEDGTLHVFGPQGEQIYTDDVATSFEEVDRG